MKKPGAEEIVLAAAKHDMAAATLIKKGTVQIAASHDFRTGYASALLSDYVQGLEKELADIKAERAKVASGKVECADCGAILARF